VKAVVPVVHRSVSLRAKIRRGLSRRTHRVIGCRSPRHATDVLRRELVDAIVVDVTAGWAGAAFELARQFPRVPMFALSPFRPDDGRLLAACHNAGFRGTFVEGVDEPVAGQMIANRTASALRREALVDAPRLLRLLEPIQRDVWEKVLTRAAVPITTSDIARAVGWSREHLSREFAAGGAPNLKRVIDLARAAWAADLLANPGYTVATVAELLRYSSPSHLTGSARRIAGVTAQELGMLGPRGVLQRFVRGRTRSRL
jgi:AraC-like DNA-binding protein